MKDRKIKKERERERKSERKSERKREKERERENVEVIIPEIVMSNSHPNTKILENLTISLKIHVFKTNLHL